MIVRSRSTRHFASFLLGAGVLLFGHSWFIEGKAVVAQVLLERAWSQTVESGGDHKPWSWADTWPVAKISMPRLGEEAIVLKSASGEAMAFGPGHVNGTPLPGTSGTSIIAAHRDTHFESLQHLQDGDEVVVETSDGQTRFVVVGSEIVRWDQSGIEPQGGTPKLALVTCYPFGSKVRGPLRYVVHLELASDPV